MMNIVISGGGMVGMTLARLLRRRGFEPIVVERMREGEFMPRGYMMGFQGFPPLEEIGVMGEIRAAGWDIAPREDGSTVAVAVNIGTVLGALARDLPVMYEHSVVDLVRDGDERVVGVVAEGPGGRTTLDADLVIACDGVMSPVRQLAGLEAKVTELSDASLSFMSPRPGAVSFKMEYFADGGHIGLLGWPEGSAGWRSIDRIGKDAALAPGLDAIKRMWTELIPESEAGVSALTSLDQVRYGEPRIMSCPRWWKPGVLIIGDSAHFFGPETGASSGLGLGDAHALAQAAMQNADDPDATCASYETWRAPVIRPYEANDPGLVRNMAATGEPPRPAEMWPPPTS